MRPIDADDLERKLSSLARLAKSDAQKSLLGRALYIVGTAPALTPQNESLTLEMVAEILAEQLGDECACNVNGNDEWLPMMCRYGDVCPDPPERLGCWMELLRNKYRRPPERQEDTDA